MIMSEQQNTSSARQTITRRYKVDSGHSRDGHAYTNTTMSQSYTLDTL